MPLATPRELLIHELNDLLSAEQLILMLLPELAREAHGQAHKKLFLDHVNETKEQITRLERAFDLLGERPEQATCYGTEGLKREHEALHQEDPSAEVMAIAGLLGAAKTEAYEVASYTGLIQLAKQLDEPGVAKFLQQTLTEEQAMAQRLMEAAKEEEETATGAA